MKKLLGMMFLAGVLAAPVAMADSGSGCGLGRQVWIGQSGMVAHILAATTNEIISPASFSITSGTSGCQADGVIFRHKEQEVFVAANFDILSQEMAQGRGSHLSSLATLMGCPVAVQGDFARLAQQKYETLFTSLDTSSEDLLQGLKRELAANPSLATCNRIS